MKHIIHDWDDLQCIRLLKNCRKAMKPGGRMLIVEQVLTDAPESVLAKLLDLEMLVMTPGGRERTESEFSELLRKAGFRMERILPTPSPVCVIEAFVAREAGAGDVPAGPQGTRAVPQDEVICPSAA